MTKASAIHNFWAGFGLPAYEENSLYAIDENPDHPFLTYELNTDSFGGHGLTLSASLWYRSASWAEANAKAEEISGYIGRGGCFIDCGGGCLWIKRGSPFTQNTGDPADDLIKRKIINISVEFLTED